MLEEIKYKADVFKYPVFNYLYRDIFDYAISNKLDIWTENKLSLEEEHLNDLINISESVMQNLLDKYYEEPTERQKSKNSGRYMRIVLNEIKYTVDYRLSPIGREIVGINYFREWLMKHNQL